MSDTNPGNTPIKISDQAIITDSVIVKHPKIAVGDGIQFTDLVLRGLPKKSVSDSMTVTESIAQQAGISPMIPAFRNGSNVYVQPVDILAATAQIPASSTDFDLFPIDYRNYASSLITFTNTDESNSVIFNVWGSNNDNNGVFPVWDETWFQITSSNGTITANTTLAEGVLALTLSPPDRWRWILVRAHSVAGVTNFRIDVTASRLS